MIASAVLPWNNFSGVVSAFNWIPLLQTNGAFISEAGGFRVTNRADCIVNGRMPHPSRPANAPLGTRIRAPVLFAASIDRNGQAIVQRLKSAAPCRVGWQALPPARRARLVGIRPRCQREPPIPGSRIGTETPNSSSRIAAFRRSLTDTAINDSLWIPAQGLARLAYLPRPFLLLLLQCWSLGRHHFWTTRDALRFELISNAEKQSLGKGPPDQLEAHGQSVACAATWKNQCGQTQEVYWTCAMREFADGFQFAWSCQRLNLSQEGNWIPKRWCEEHIA